MNRQFVVIAYDEMVPGVSGAPDSICLTVDTTPYGPYDIGEALSVIESIEKGDTLKAQMFPIEPWPGLRNAELREHHAREL